MLPEHRKETIDTYNQYAQQYLSKEQNRKIYDYYYKEFCTLIPKENPKIFEIACGPGNVTYHLLKELPKAKILAIDLAENMIELARDINPGAEFKVMDCRDILQIQDKYDAIMCGFCLPYLSKEETAKLIEDSSALLEPKGIMYISTMEGDYESSGFETASSGEGRMFIYMHEKTFLDEIIEKSGFEILKFSRNKCVEPDGKVYDDMIYIIQKNK